MQVNRRRRYVRMAGRVPYFGNRPTAGQGVGAERVAAAVDAEDLARAPVAGTARG